VTRRVLVALLLWAATVPLAPLAAQARPDVPTDVRPDVRPGVEIQLPTATRLTAEGPLVRSRAVLSDSYLRELLQSGFPARLHFRVELWADGRIFDELQRSVDWDVVVQLSPKDGRFEVLQVVGGRPLSLGSFERIQDAEAAAARPVRVPINAPAENRRFYYLASLEIIALSGSDLEEMNRWLRGELQPTVTGNRNPGTALTRGFRTLATRLLGGERREFSERSPSFRPATR